MSFITKIHNTKFICAFCGEQFFDHQLNYITPELISFKTKNKELSEIALKFLDFKPICQSCEDKLDEQQIKVHLFKFEMGLD